MQTLYKTSGLGKEIGFIVRRSMLRLIRTHARSLVAITDLPQHLALCTLNHRIADLEPRAFGTALVSMVFSIPHK